MAKPFDATLNTLIRRHLDDWVQFLGQVVGSPIGPAKFLERDLSFTLQADRLIQIDANPAYILHLELEASAALGMPDRLLTYNFTTFNAYELPVQSVVLLLRPRGNPSDLTGVLERQILGQTYLRFHYRVIRLWELPFEMLLNSGIGLLPLAMLCNDVTDPLASMIRIEEKLSSEKLTAKMQLDETSAIYFLMGLRYNREEIQNLFRVMTMTLEESTTYQYVLGLGQVKGLAKGLAKGREEGRQEGEVASTVASILRLGKRRIGEAPPDIATRIQATTDLVALQNMLDRILDAKSWQEVVDGF
jgi:hypothetical protein